MNGAVAPVRPQVSAGHPNGQAVEIAEPGYLPSGKLWAYLGISESHWKRKVRPALVAHGVEQLPVAKGRKAWSVPQAKAVLRQVFGGEA